MELEDGAYVHLDIGCARGRWLLDIAAAPPLFGATVYHLGVEIRGDLVIAANQIANDSGLAHQLLFLHADMAIANKRRRLIFSRLGSCHPVAPSHGDLTADAKTKINNEDGDTCMSILAAVSILFPDPWHEHDVKRGSFLRKRTLTPSLADEIACALAVGGVLLVFPPWHFVQLQLGYELLPSAISLCTGGVHRLRQVAGGQRYVRNSGCS
jgi:tRNA (guanine-N7-)-methyltransferase